MSGNGPSAGESPPPWREHPLVLALRAALAKHRDVVLQAPTGAGKSTLVPLALLEEPFVAGHRILMLEPRRLAARAVAARMAQLRGEPLGAAVGYRMRLDTRVSAATRIEVLTEGVLTRLLQEDPALEGVACLIFDEYHERSLQADLGLALALDARRELQTGLRLLVMSATLEAERIAALLEDAAVVSVPGRAHPVQIRYLGRGPPLLPVPELAVARAVQLALGDTPGDILAFLPGAGEILRVQAELTPDGSAHSVTPGAAPSHVQVLALYGELGAEAQDAALAPSPPGMRKVVLATNIAETSVTIPGVTAVVDSGLARRSRFDPATGMNRLELTPISRAASEQRAGRAGRTAPGICYRLWSAAAQQRLAVVSPPEILEADLAPLALDLARWGAAEGAGLAWLDPPPPASLAQARELLVRLATLDSAGRLTPPGQAMARLPVHPRLARMLLGALALDALPLAARLAALLSERDLLRATSPPRAGEGSPGERDPDIRTRLELLDMHAGGAAVQRVRRAARLLERAVARLAPSKEIVPTNSASGDLAPAGAGSAAASARGVAASAGPAAGDQGAGLGLSGAHLPGALLALAYPDRIGQRRKTGGYLLANGRGASFPRAVSLAREPWIVAVELDDRDREARIDLAAPVTLSALESLYAGQIIAEERFGWDEASEALMARRVRRLGAVVLEERTLPAAQDERALPAMLETLQRLGLEALPWDEQSRALQARLQFVRSLGRPELADWPASDDATLLATLPQWLGPYLSGVTRRTALSRVPLRAALAARLTRQQQRALEALAPRALAVPSGSVLPIDYRGERAPSLSVRLQEMFGLGETPRVGGGAVPVTLELLSPARRPVQVTRDLAGFWRGSYAEVRRDLRGRYPKHDWPEDPLAAQSRFKSARDR